MREKGRWGAGGAGAKGQHCLKLRVFGFTLSTNCLTRDLRPSNGANVARICFLRSDPEAPASRRTHSAPPGEAHLPQALTQWHATRYVVAIAPPLAIACAPRKETAAAPMIAITGRRLACARAGGHAGGREGPLHLHRLRLHLRRAGAVHLAAQLPVPAVQLRQEAVRCLPMPIPATRTACSPSYPAYHTLTPLSARPLPAPQPKLQEVHRPRGRQG